jgi:two-component system, NarL family, invasion response regulator UvrY
MIKILIADDHPLIREGLLRILKSAPEMTVVAQASSADEAMEHVQKLEIDIVLLDISLPGRSGLEILGEIRTLFPKLPVLVISMYPEERYAVQALKKGASGYLTKEGAADQLIQAIRKVLQGRKYVSAVLAEKLARNLLGDSERSHEKLSDRELEVFRLISVGRTIRQISEELSLSMSTINTYRARILEKMNMKSDAELIRYAIQNDITTLEDPSVSKK